MLQSQDVCLRCFSCYLLSRSQEIWKLNVIVMTSVEIFNAFRNVWWNDSTDAVPREAQSWSLTLICGLVCIIACSYTVSHHCHVHSYFEVPVMSHMKSSTDSAWKCRKTILERLVRLPRASNCVKESCSLLKFCKFLIDAVTMRHKLLLWIDHCTLLLEIDPAQR